jgi:hypothetical protein
VDGVSPDVLHHSLRAPDPKPADVRYREFVVFHSEYTYPEYLLAYQRFEGDRGPLACVYRAGARARVASSGTDHGAERAASRLMCLLKSCERARASSMARTPRSRRRRTGAAGPGRARGAAFFVRRETEQSRRSRGAAEESELGFEGVGVGRVLELEIGRVESREGVVSRR